MELFGGKKKEKFTLALHRHPEECTPPELAAVIGITSQLADFEKAGLDPTTVHLVFQFKKTGHAMCVNLERGGDGKPAFNPGSEECVE